MPGCAQKQKPVEENAHASITWPDSISIPHFSKKQFSGTGFTRGKILDDNTAYTRYFITYKSGTMTISGIMNVPKGKGPYPLLILNHGYINPRVYTNGRGLKREQDYLARRGYVVIHPDYRNHAQSDKDTINSPRFRLTYVEDVINAVLAVRNADLPYVDKERIGMLGHSMGGGIALNVMVAKPDLVKAFVLFGTVSADLLDNFYHWDANRPGLMEKVFREYGSPNENPAFWQNLSPMTFFDQVVSPVQIHHAITDESCPVAWARKIRDSLQVHQKTVTFFEYPNEKHEFINAWPLVMERTAGFFDEHLKTHTDGI
ncbi:MAG: alpha/beta fold hydrolase [Bacteroidetes bacterium]|nr:alpha/beta fold hydrolase [Bacteroidota bacterium]